MDNFIDFFFISPAFRAGLFFILGLCIGSFVTALTYRIPRKLNWTTDRSRCTSCNHVLGVPDLVPVLSWLCLRGKCRHCSASIPARYPLIELGFGISGALLGLIQ